MRSARYLHSACAVAAVMLLLGACTHDAPVTPATTTVSTPAIAVTSPGSAASASSAPTTAPASSAPVPTGTPTPPASDTPTIPGAQAMVTGSGPSSDGASFEVSGVVFGIIEDGGTCTFTLTTGSAAVSRSRDGLSDASDTSCGTVDLPTTELPNGAWTATLTYTSSSGTVTSAPAAVTVP